MSDHLGTQKPASDPDPGRLCAEHWFLIVSAVGITAAVVAYFLDATLDIEINRGAYAIMVAVFVACFVAWMVRSAEGRVRRDLAGEIRRMTATITEVRDQAAGLGNSASADTWWSGYATAIEDQEAGTPRTVLPFRSPRGDRNGDSGPRVNGSELL